MNEAEQEERLNEIRASVAQSKPILIGNEMVGVFMSVDQFKKLLDLLDDED